MADAPLPAKNRVRIYGPVPSRRLGLSLGVDILPPKTCSFDCVYCQLGPGRKTVGRRGAFVPPEEVIAQVRRSLKKTGRVDSITFSGSGEPTLHSGLGRMIRGIKSFTETPVTVLTNASLLSKPSVRRSLLAADRVVPSLDAAEALTFRRINRPHPSFSLKDILRGLTDFRREYKGQIWLEVMLVKGLNDSPAHIRDLKKAVARIRPDKVQLNTVVRPPAEAWARPLPARDLERIRRKLGARCEVAAPPRRKGRPPGVRPGFVKRVLAVIERRPVTASDLSRALGVEVKTLAPILARLQRWGRIHPARHQGRTFYRPAAEHREQK